MGRTACTESQCLYIASVPVQSLSTCTRVHLKNVLHSNILYSGSKEAIFVKNLLEMRFVAIHCWNLTPSFYEHCNRGVQMNIDSEWLICLV